MRILFTNDDGYDSKELHAVADLFKNKFDIAVVAPDMQKSGYSHSISLKPNRISFSNVSGYDYDVYSVVGSPADCVKLAATKLFIRPDVVVSGINRGRNIGTDILYSGTVSAATEGALWEAKCFALSYDGDDCLSCAAFFAQNFEKLLLMCNKPRTIININFPSGKPKGVKAVRMCTTNTYKDSYSPLGAEYILDGARDYSALQAGTDEHDLRNGYITITPLAVDRTDYEALSLIDVSELKS